MAGTKTERAHSCIDWEEATLADLMAMLEAERAYLWDVNLKEHFSSGILLRLSETRLVKDGLLIDLNTNWWKAFFSKGDHFVS